MDYENCVNHIKNFVTSTALLSPIFVIENEIRLI